MVAVDPWPEVVFLESAKSKGLMQAGRSPLFAGAPADFAAVLSLFFAGTACVVDDAGFGV